MKKFQCKNCQTIFDEEDISTPMDMGDWIYVTDCCPECKAPYDWFTRRKDLDIGPVPEVSEEEKEEARSRTIIMLGVMGPSTADRFMILRYFTDRIMDGGKEKDAKEESK